MKIMIDTNIILDVLYKREDFYEDSLNIFRLCETKTIIGYVSTLSIANIIYIMRKDLSKEKINELLTWMSIIFKIVDLKSDDLINAAAFNIKDFEDALQYAQAKRIKANFIVTRNIKDYLNISNKNTEVILPKNLFEKLI